MTQYPRMQLDPLPAEAVVGQQYGNWQAALRSRKRRHPAARPSPAEAEALRSAPGGTLGAPSLPTSMPTSSGVNDTGIPPWSGLQSVLQHVSLTPGLLDRHVILQSAFAKDPSEVARCNLAGRELCSVMTGDLATFDNLVHLDVSDNSLPFPLLAALPRLKVLDLSLNELTTLQLPPGFFANLEVLDLSYNTLGLAAILELAPLPRLTSLNLSGNQLDELPLAMSGMTGTGQRESFRVLETLILDDNELQGATPFQAVAGLPRLRHMSMNRNYLTFIPHLVPENVEGLDVPDSGLPFPELQVLAVAENRIEAARDVMEVAQWRKLRELHLWGNPLTRTSRAGLPRELDEVLTLHCGIAVIRHPPKMPRCAGSHIVR